jgi:hypothetical protein
MAPKGATRRTPLTLDLKFDGKNAVSGTAAGPNPGEIKTGTFDPKTGALKLEIYVNDDGRSRFVFEGTVVQSTVTGSVSGNNQTGDFKFTRRVPVSGEPPAPQHSEANDAASALRKSFGEVSGWVTKAADLVPADKYNYRPTPGVRTLGQLIGHIADGYGYSCAQAEGRNTQWSDAIEKGATDKATLVSKLKQSLVTCDSAYGHGQTGPLIENIAHTNLHYGNLVTYMRMLGLTPPSSN